MDNISGNVLTKILDNYEKLGIRKELIEMAKLAFATMVVKKTVGLKLNVIIRKEAESELVAYLKSTPPVPEYSTSRGNSR